MGTRGETMQNVFSNKQLLIRMTLKKQRDKSRAFTRKVTGAVPYDDTSL